MHKCCCASARDRITGQWLCHVPSSSTLLLEKMQTISNHVGLHTQSLPHWWAAEGHICPYINAEMTVQSEGACAEPDRLQEFHPHCSPGALLQLCLFRWAWGKLTHACANSTKNSPKLQAGFFPHIHAHVAMILWSTRNFCSQVFPPPLSFTPTHTCAHTLLPTHRHTWCTSVLTEGVQLFSVAGTVLFSWFGMRMLLITHCFGGF